MSREALATRQKDKNRRRLAPCAAESGTRKVASLEKKSLED